MTYISTYCSKINEGKCTDNTVRILDENTMSDHDEKFNTFKNFVGCGCENTDDMSFSSTDSSTNSLDDMDVFFVGMKT